MTLKKKSECASGSKTGDSRKRQNQDSNSQLLPPLFSTLLYLMIS